MPSGMAGVVRCRTCGGEEARDLPRCPWCGRAGPPVRWPRLLRRVGRILVASDIVGLALPWPVAFAAEVLGPVRGEFLAELAYAFGMLAMAPALLFLAPVLIFAWLCSWLGRVKHPRPLLAVSWDLEVGGSSHVVSLPLPAGPTPAFVWLDGRQVPLD